jgi:hypothetical protein
MTDRELLELAAKAAGIEYSHDNAHWKHEDHCAFWSYDDLCTCGARWNPLDDDGDALRLAVKLGFCVNIKERCVVAGNSPTNDWQQPHGDDPEAATRRAIVRAAAEIGKAMRPLDVVHQALQDEAEEPKP